MCNFNFLVAMFKREAGQVNLILGIDLPQGDIPQILLSQPVINILKISNKIVHFLFFFTLSLRNLVCIFHLPHISIQTSHLPRAQQPHVTSGNFDPTDPGLTPCQSRGARLPRMDCEGHTFSFCQDRKVQFLVCLPKLLYAYVRSLPFCSFTV